MQDAELQPITGVVGSEEKLALLDYHYQDQYQSISIPIPTHRNPPPASAIAMAALSRVPLASLVCPSLPFLAPRLLRTAASTCTRAYATRTKTKTKPPRSTPSGAVTAPSTTPVWPKTKFRNKQGHVRYNRQPSDPRLAAQAQLIAHLRNACEHVDFAKIMELYPTLLSEGILSGRDTRQICQALHTAMRLLKPTDPKRAELFVFFQTVVADLRSGALETYPYAYVHLLSTYKELNRFAEGRELWEWLAEDDDRVSLTVYGAAIELLAAGSLLPLPDLEALYSEGLKRFPGTFAEYHLSPDAIVPDRTRPVSIAGLSANLLQGILTARLLAGDWKKSYLALDTALRLFPAQTPPRFFELFMQNRPLSEAYTSFLVACRAGTHVNANHARNLISKLRLAITKSRSLAKRMMLLRAIVNAIYAYQQATNRVVDTHISGLFHAFASLLPQNLPGENYQGEDVELRNIIVVTAHQVVANLLQSGMPPTPVVFASVVNMAGKLNVSDLLTVTLGDIQRAGLELNESQLGTVLASAGILGNHELVEEFWSRIVTSFEGRGLHIDYSSWITLARACRRANHTSFAREQLSKLEHTLDHSLKKKVENELDAKDTVPDADLTRDMTPAQLKSQMELLQAQMRNVEATIMSGTRLDIQKSPFYMHIDPEHPSLGSDENLRAVYDEFTTDPYQPPAPAPADGPPAKDTLSPTGIPLDELRFRNWVTIVEMTSEAEAYEAEREARAKWAIATQKPASLPPALRIHESKEDMFHSKEALQLKVKQLRLPSREKAAEIPQDTPESA